MIIKILYIFKCVCYYNFEQQKKKKRSIALKDFNVRNVGTHTFKSWPYSTEKDYVNAAEGFSTFYTDVKLEIRTKSKI